MPVSHLYVWTDDNGEQHDVIHHIPLALRMLCKGCYRISIVLAFLHERAKTIQICSVANPPPPFPTLFLNGEKKSPSSKISGYVLTWPNSSITLLRTLLRPYTTNGLSGIDQLYVHKGH